MAGLSNDVRLLCRELAAANASWDESVLAGLLRRTGMAARSDSMRTLSEVLSQIPHERRAAVLVRSLGDAGEPLPTGLGVRCLLSLPGQVRDDDD
jgi:hypothetical protein